MNDTTNSTRNAKATKKFLAGDGSTSAHASPAAVALVISFANGQDLTIEPRMFNETVRQCFALHGMSQKFGDSYAGVGTADAAYDACATLVEAMSGDDGSWLQNGESAGPRVSMLAEAVARAKPEKYTVESAAAMLKEKDKAARASIAAIPTIKTAFAAIRAEKAIAAAHVAAAKAGVAGEVSEDF